MQDLTAEGCDLKLKKFGRLLVFLSSFLGTNI